MVLEYILMLSWLGFIVISSTLEAVYFYKKKAHVKWFGRNIHDSFTVIRSIFAVPISIITLVYVGWWEAVLMSILLILVFPFFHDGIYYTVRELIQKGTYPLYWFDQSEDTDAKYSYSIVTRTIFLIAALLMFPW